MELIILMILVFFVPLMFAVMGIALIANAVESIKKTMRGDNK